MAVTYIAQRATSLSALFYLISILTYLDARNSYFSNNERISNKIVFLYLICGFSALLSILSKQNAVTLPVILWITEYFFIQNNKGFRAGKFLKISGAIITLIFLFVVVSGLLPRQDPDYSRWQYLVTQFRVYLIYFKLIFIPYGFNADHGLELSDSLFGVYELTGLIVIVALISLGFYARKKAPLISYGIFWYFITMSIESGIIPITDLVMEHRNYLPLIGVVLIFSYVLFYLFSKKRAILYTLFAVLIIFLSIRTYNRNLDWENNTTLWISSLEENPDNKRALVYIGRAYVKTDPEKALQHFNRAIQVDSSYYHGWLNRGLILFDMGKYSDVVKSINKAYECSDIRHDYSYFVRGVSNIMINDYNTAIKDFSKYINRTGGNAETFTYRGQAYYYAKKYVLAAKDFINAYQLNPSQTGLILNIVECYYRAKKPRLMNKYAEMARKKNLTLNAVYLQYLHAESGKITHPAEKE
jgi:tetratricopeptide (TPR) repeat protein